MIAAAIASSTEAQCSCSQSPGHDPTHPKGGTKYHWWMFEQPHHYYTLRRSEFLLIYPAATHPCTSDAQCSSIRVLTAHIPRGNVLCVTHTTSDRTEFLN
ncbi:hypothetical protein AVEN_168312-1 [Araneus ventricosus]|uniref:Uncharacterized protein n=1 Tax=Araneus ventricosus TaxID=182803 RepID=A0A4Y2HWU5_ARAVE|nr:hypothetical protein AVEN_168312-1 [Araneus ventricosus]